MRDLTTILGLARSLERTWGDYQPRPGELVNLLEPNIYGLWGGKQAAKGTPNDAPSHRLPQAAGDFALEPDDGEERISDGTKYGTSADFVNSRTGAGEPGVQGEPTSTAWILWMFHGAETVTAEAGPPASSKHSFVPTTGRGHWGSYFRRVGRSVVQRHQYNDSLISRVVVEGSTGQKVVRVTPRIMSLAAGEVQAADPAAALPTDKAFLYTDGAGAFELNETVIRAQSQFALTIDEDLSYVYGDDVVPHDLAQGQASVGIGVTLLMDPDVLALWNELVYGAAAPAAGTMPLDTVPPLGSYGVDLVQRDDADAPTGRRFVLDVPGVKWTIPAAPAPNPAGGATEVALAGSMRPVAGEEPYTIDVYTDPAVVAFAA